MNKIQCSLDIITKKQLFHVLSAVKLLFNCWSHNQRLGERVTRSLTNCAKEISKRGLLAVISSIRVKSAAPLQQMLVCTWTASCGNAPVTDELDCRTDNSPTPWQASQRKWCPWISIFTLAGSYFPICILSLTARLRTHAAHQRHSKQRSRSSRWALQAVQRRCEGLFSEANSRNIFHLKMNFPNCVFPEMTPVIIFSLLSDALKNCIALFEVSPTAGG